MRHRVLASAETAVVEIAETPAMPAIAAPAVVVARETQEPTSIWVALVIAASLALAFAGQSALLRTRAPMPAGALFLVACGLGGWAALRRMQTGERLRAGVFPRFVPDGRTKVLLGATVLANSAGLALFGKGAALTLAWLLFVLSVALAAVGVWRLDGRPRLQVAWRQEAPWLAALGVLVVVGAALRLAALDHIPFGLWFDEAYSGLEVERILSDPSFRPVYVGGLAQEPSLLWYLMAVGFKIAGPGQLALRLPAALGGVLGIPAIYLLGRELFDRKVGLIAAGLLTTLVWHLTFSRLGFNVTSSVALDALALFFLARAVKRGSWTAAALAGISLGFGLQMYYTSRLMVVVIGLFLVLFWLAQPRQRFGVMWRALAVACFAGVITASPLLEFAIQHPAEFSNRLQQASVFTEVRNQHSYTPITDNLKAHLLMFNVAGDRNARHNLPGQPQLNLLLGGLFVLGLGLSLARARQPQYLLLPLWGVVMLTGGVLSVAFEAPQSLRTIDEVNVVVLLCALPLALLWESASSAGLRHPKAAGSIDLARWKPALLERSPVFGWLRAHPLVALLPVWTLVMLYMTNPLWRNMSRATLPGEDSLEFLWILWWTKYALLTLHQLPFSTTY
ncbi:MAG TPA: glycosyltransferase family 39 protein, partial [Chloroflexota bacterium]